MLSSHNPFRNKGLSPQSTGTSSVGTSQSNSSGSSSQDVAGQRHTPPPRTASRSALDDSDASSHTTSYDSPLPPLPADDLDILTQELPPAYTPAPDVAKGESTIDMGPRRPFQEPARLPRQQQRQYITPIPSSWRAQQYASTFSLSGWAQYPGGQRGARGQANPPPSHPSLHRPARPSSAPNSDSDGQPLSDFAREFYAAGADVPGLNAETSGGAAGPGSRRQGSSAAPDDGRPTEQPTPGHPLLRHGKVLQYPAGHECDRCHNTGYRNNDPTSPCLRCWDKYGRPFSGALTYISWNAPPDPSSRHAYQRPLPRFTPPHLSGSGSGHRPSQSYGGLGSESPLSAHPRIASLSRPSGAYAGGTGPRVIPVAGGGVAMSPYLDPLQNVPTNVRGANNAPPGATILRPGDPRIGGRLCWRCGGDGVTSTFLFLDEETCSLCGGIGRTFV
ncbi:hypothetical protein POSPLADRAFT_1054652 [Postia placenta MAD-698-R-SB12]|uniref:Uncharacterized protein n=1 Tax=Postia placenta MAD-698-R-SB12 TaxID=670580 RepID=A0A1X6N5V1_9APHY|nr:hypothetical protein POSPLADRAFT_1054652 [Postia placenta MAD-698-R-SB12]OSX64029.1 hypothetical protein POSPLADRAFT_1054652 [Postia placenta MAD-698-R-SB12]